MAKPIEQYLIKFSACNIHTENRDTRQELASILSDRFPILKNIQPEDVEEIVKKSLDRIEFYSDGKKYNINMTEVICEIALEHIDDFQKRKANTKPAKR